MQENKKVIKHTSKNLEQYNAVFREAVDILRRCEIRDYIPVEQLRNAGEKLIEAIGINETKPEPYVCLAYVFFQLKDKDSAFKYLKIAKEIDPNCPEINELKNMILKHYLKI